VTAAAAARARPGRPAVRGRLHCTAAPAPRGGARVTSSASGPLHPVHHPVPGGPDVLLLTTDTAGLTGGDSLEVTVHLTAGAALLVSDPAPTHLLPGPDVRPGCQTTRVRVAAGARLVLLPHALVPYRRSRSAVRTVVDVTPGSSAVVGGVLSPGRVATGEVWAPGRLDSTTDLLVDGKLLVRDALRVDGPRATPADAGHLVSLLVYAEDVAGLLGPVRTVAGAAAGVSALTDDLLALRAVVGTQQSADALLRAVTGVVRPDLAEWSWTRIGFAD
jgi:urease accessory protein UreH